MHNMAAPASRGPNVHLCSICNKPFNTEFSRNRHVRYCSRRTRTRPRSCQACNAAKTKCTFDSPCSRCTKRGIECVYENIQARPPVDQIISEPATFSHEKENESDLQAPHSIPYTGENVLFDNDFDTQWQFMPDMRQPHITTEYDNGYEPVNLNNTDSSFGKLLAFDGLHGFVQDNFGPLATSADLVLPTFENSDLQAASWCTWMRRGVSLSAVTEKSLVRLDSQQHVILQKERPYAQYNADLIIQSLRSIPTMMLRRETLPWFIHPRSQPLTKPSSTALPEALSTCMSIAQLFAGRKAETAAFLWRNVRIEARNFVSEMHEMSKFELLAAIQACMVYLIMYILEFSSENEADGLELLLALHDLYLLFKETCGGFSSLSEIARPSANWEEWIFAESQRRLSSLWFLVGCVVCIKNGSMCDPSQSYRRLPLPSPKTLWEASTPSVWESEYEANNAFQLCGLITLGDLIDAQNTASLPASAKKLDEWNAKNDNLGILLNLIKAMV